jgi:hypothetical protein
MLTVLEGLLKSHKTEGDTIQRVRLDVRQQKCAIALTTKEGVQLGYDLGMDYP